MPLTPAAAVEQAQRLYNVHLAERAQLDIVRQYWVGRQALPAVIPSGSPHEVKVMARASRSNFMRRVIDAMTQKVVVSGFRGEREADDADVWRVWQVNGMDALQTAIHEAAFAYGTSYAIVLPGRGDPEITAASPRALTALYGEDRKWPMWALERRGGGSWRLYDDEAMYFLGRGAGPDDRFEFIDYEEHHAGVTPVVRYLNKIDLDADDEVADARPVFGGVEEPVAGEVAPLMRFQDRLDLNTFGGQIAQHYNGFRQRYIIGWVAPSEEATLKASAARVWTFDEDANEMKIGEFEQTTIDGYLRAQEATIRQIAIVSQTPLHDLMPDLANPTSAEALAAQESSHERKLGSRKVLLGESHEQTLRLAGVYAGIDVPDGAQVSWEDTSARAFAATVDGLGKLTQMLGIPPQELWERVPGATQQDVERWKAAAQNGDSFRMLSDLLGQQATPATPAG